MDQFLALLDDFFVTCTGFLFGPVIPDVESHIFSSVENVCLDTVIAYKQKGQRHHFLEHYE